MVNSLNLRIKIKFNSLQHNKVELYNLNISCLFSHNLEIHSFSYFYIMQITAIILAGGKSIRMGTDKALLEMEQTTLLEKVIRLCETFTTQILISSDNPEHEKFGYKIIHDEIKNCGPLGGIYTCLKHSETDWNFVISVDSPFVEQDFVSFFISEIADFDAIVPIHKNGKEPLIALFQKGCVKTIHENIMSGDNKMHNLLEKINTKFVDSQKWVAKYPTLFRNLNRPEDLS